MAFVNLHRLSSHIHRLPSLSFFSKSLIARASASSVFPPSSALSKKVSDRFVKLFAIDLDGQKREVVGLSGQTLPKALANTGLIDPDSHRLEEIDACSVECKVNIAQQWLEKLPSRSYDKEYVLKRNSRARVLNKHSRLGCLVVLTPELQGHVRGFSSMNAWWNNKNKNDNASPDFNPDSQRNINPSSHNNAETRKSSTPMDFVRGVIEMDGKGVMGGAQLSRSKLEHDADFVHIKLLRNNTFVTVTDSKGNIKLNASAGCLKEMKGGQKLSRYAAEATAEEVGRRARRLGLKSVVMKVKGFMYFRKKRQAIVSWREGFTDSRGDRNPIIYIEDTTRRPHNGCRLPKRRRI